MENPDLQRVSSKRDAGQGDRGRHPGRRGPWREPGSLSRNVGRKIVVPVNPFEDGRSCLVPDPGRGKRDGLRWGVCGPVRIVGRLFGNAFPVVGRSAIRWAITVKLSGRVSEDRSDQTSRLKQKHRDFDVRPDPERGETATVHPSKARSEVRDLITCISRPGPKTVIRDFVGAV